MENKAIQRKVKKQPLP